MAHDDAHQGEGDREERGADEEGQHEAQESEEDGQHEASIGRR